LGGHGLPVTAVVTEMRFDTASATPKLTFKAVRPLEEDEMATCQEKGQSADAKAAIASTVAQTDGTKVKAIEAPAPKAAPKVEAEVTPEVEPTKRTKKAAPKDVDAILDDWAE